MMRIRSGSALLTIAALAVTAVPAAVDASTAHDGSSPRTRSPHAGLLDKERDPQAIGAAKGSAAASARRAVASPSMLSSSPAVALEPCEDDPAWLCGSIPVPIDRSRPHGRQLDLAFAVFPHTNPASTAKDAFFASDGGPGIANIANRGFQFFLNGDLSDDRDFVVVDHRGTGQSGAIDCPRLGHVIGDFESDPETIIRAIGQCGRQLGRDADRYGSGDIAMDLDAVRRALGYPKINLYGQSYAGAFLSAYATRFPGHTRAVVVDAGTPTTDERHAWTWGMDIPPAFATAAALHCERAPACAAAQPRAGSAFARLAEALRRHPLRGTVDISELGRRHVVADEWNLVSAAGDILNQAELAAAADALDHGDRAPMLRLAGEIQLAPFEPADPTFDSAGDNVAVFCNDNDFVWDRSDPLSVRQAKYRAALRALGRDAFAPVSVQTWTGHFLTDYCIRWPAPDRFTPSVEDGAVATSMPVLMLSGDLDTVVPTRTSRGLLDVFPEATFVQVAGAAHPSAGWSECAANLVHDFVRTLVAPPATACDEPGFVASSTSSFPRVARDAVAASSRSGDSSAWFDRKVVTAAVQTVRDAWIRSFKVPGAIAGVSGLRGGHGAFDYTLPDHATMDMDGLRFVRDLAVTGTTSLFYESNALHFYVNVRGQHGYHGSLTADGAFGFGGPFDDFVVTGLLNGHHIDVTVPAN